MKGAIVHGVLLVLMLVFAYETWTRETSTKPSNGSVVLWDEKASDLQAIVDETPDRTVKIEKKGEGDAAYWWGTQTTITKPPKPPAPADGGVAPPAPPAETKTVEFPVDIKDEGVARMLTGYPEMRAIRDLGPLDDDLKQQYKLTDTDKTIQLIFADKHHSLVLGDHVVGGEDRYVLDVDSGHGYIIAGALVSPLEGGEHSLEPRSLVPTGDEVAKIDLATPDGKTKSISRITVKTDDSEKPIKTWGDPSTQKADQTAANFLTKIDGSAHPMKYEATLDPSTLTKLITLTYHDAHGKTLATLDLYKKPGAPPPPPPTQPGQPPPPPPGPQFDYYIVTETTRVPAQISKQAGDQIEQNIGPVFAE